MFVAKLIVRWVIAKMIVDPEEKAFLEAEAARKWPLRSEEFASDKTHNAAQRTFRRQWIAETRRTLVDFIAVVRGFAWARCSDIRVAVSGNKSMFSVNGYPLDKETLAKMGVLYPAMGLTLAGLASTKSQQSWPSPEPAPLVRSDAWSEALQAFMPRDITLRVEVEQYESMSTVSR